MFSLSKQWFVHMDPLAEKALLAVENKELTIIPERFEKIYNHWLTNIKDWCISRQLWWGHRIPVWYVVGKDCEEDYIVAKNAEEALEKAHEKYGKDVEIYQDPDVLDTWFSRFVLLITKIQACLANFDSSAKARRANQHINHLWRAQSDISNAQNESAAPHKQKLIASEPSASSSSNLERFLEFVTPSVLAQYLSKTSLLERRADDVFDEPVPYFVLGDVYGTHL